VSERRFIMLKKAILTFALFATVAFATLVLPSTAEAQRWRRGGYGGYYSPSVYVNPGYSTYSGAYYAPAYRSSSYYTPAYSSYYTPAYSSYYAPAYSSYYAPTYSSYSTPSYYTPSYAYPSPRYYTYPTYSYYPY